MSALGACDPDIYRELKTLVRDIYKLICVICYFIIYYFISLVSNYLVLCRSYSISS